MSLLVSDGSDLPLFSGTAPKARDQPFKPASEARQARLTGLCPICFGTGYVKLDRSKSKLTRCACPVGQRGE